jgi:hypothetical protein
MITVLPAAAEIAHTSGDREVTTTEFPEAPPVGAGREKVWAVLGTLAGGSKVTVCGARLMSITRVTGWAGCHCELPPWLAVIEHPWAPIPALTIVTVSP